MKKRFIAFINRRYVHTPGMPTCGAETLPAVDFDFCDPKIETSEIQRVFLGKVGSSDFTDWTQAEEWIARISEDSDDDDAIRAITCIGDKPLPNAPKKIISNGRTVIPRKEHTVNFTVDEATAANHGLVQGVKDGKRYKFHYETSGGSMFGGNGGIIVELTGDMVLARGAGEIMVYQFVATWVNKQTEEKCVSPIFGETLLGSTFLDTTIDFTTDATPALGDSDFILVGGTNAVAKFRYNEINPTIGAAITMTVKVSGVLKLTMNTKADFAGQPFIFKDIAGVEHSGFIAAGDVTF